MDNSIRSLNNFIDKGSITSQQILVVALCFIFNMLDGFDITAMAVVASSVSLDLNLTDDLLGWIFSFALAGMMVGAMVLAPVADIIGRRALIILSLILVGLSMTKQFECHFIHWVRISDVKRGINFLFN